MSLLQVGLKPVLIVTAVGKVYGQTSRDMRRLGKSDLDLLPHRMLTRCLDSVTRSPLYSIYGETIAGVTVIRAFGASSKFLRDMLCCVDTVRPFTHAFLPILTSLVEYEPVLLDVGRYVVASH